MRMIFGVVGLLIVLAIVGMLAKTQLKSVQATAVAPSTAPAESGQTVKQQSQQLQQQIKDDVTRSMQQGAKRADDQ